ncbi:hypothetical protein CBR_g11107 [Chara braunii]|uniref:DNA mismatch repair protein S5 domain-containing protein n=1 Tax=Chara braunii TaxID=69332 RepID=A0A388KQ41_CHABU|nr:hypothetical protein CBR_g11107 [Chara braunii]|eukprot:GBG72174.1 hypothetical protein CBR_g11107 [Chara braunii]
MAEWELPAQKMLRKPDPLQDLTTKNMYKSLLQPVDICAELRNQWAEGGGSLIACYKDGKLDPPEPRPCAAVKGTQILVENLFYNSATRKRAFKNPSEEYARMLDVITRYAIQKNNVGFSCKKFGESRADVHTVPTVSRIDTIRAVFGQSVARELIPLHVEVNDSSQCRFKLEGFVSSANYSAKKTTLILFINERLVECSALKKACEAVYAAILPKASKPFLYMSILMPPEDVDVNVHPTKREVSFLNQESLTESVQKAVEEKLLESNSSRTFYTQTVLPGACVRDSEGMEPSQKPPAGSQSQKQPVYKLVRSDEFNPAGRLHAFLQKGASKKDEGVANLAITRRAIRQRKNPSEGVDLTSVQEVLADMNQQVHQGLSEIVKHNSYVGIADDIFVLLQHKTKLYLANIVALSKELVYQQVFRRFAQFQSMRLSSPARLFDILMIALEEEEEAGRWDESDGPKDEIAKLNEDLLVCKAEMLQEYFGMDIDDEGYLHGLPVVLDQHTPDLNRLPQFILALGNNVDWDSEKECFETFAAALADFYCCHPFARQDSPMEDRTAEAAQSPHTRQKRQRVLGEDDQDDGCKTEQEIGVQGERADHSGDEEDNNTGPNNGACCRQPEEKGAVEEKGLEKREEECDGKEGRLRAGSDTLESTATRDWMIQHLWLPSIRLFLKPPAQMAQDGTFVQVACLEKLYKIFERC